jgi:hypothetical protein
MVKINRTVKRLVRVRMAETGENYTRALRAVLAQLSTENHHDDRTDPPTGHPQRA